MSSVAETIRKEYLTRVRPDVLEKTGLGCELVDAVVRLALFPVMVSSVNSNLYQHKPDESTESKGGVSWQHLSLLVNVADVQLDRGVIMGLDESVGGSALSWHVKVDELSILVLHGCLFVM